MQFTGGKEKLVKRRKAALGAFRKKVCEMQCERTFFCVRVGATSSVSYMQSWDTPPRDSEPKPSPEPPAMNGQDRRPLCRVAHRDLHPLPIPSHQKVHSAANQTPHHAPPRTPPHVVTCGPSRAVVLFETLSAPQAAHAGHAAEGRACQGPTPAPAPFADWSGGKSTELRSRGRGYTTGQRTALGSANKTMPPPGPDALATNNTAARDR